MAVLKMFQDRQGTYVSALTALRQALKEQLTWKKCACKNGKELRTAQNDIGGLMSALENRRQQYVRVVRERDVNQDRIMQLTREQDDALHLAQIRDNARIMTGIRAEIRENELLRQIEELQVDVHRLNKQINLIPHPIPVYPMVGGPQVIIADDDGMDLDANVVAVTEVEDKEEE